MMFSTTRLFTVAGAVACLTASLAMAQAPIKIGFIGTLSGMAATLGQDLYDGFMLEVEQNGGKLGGVPVQILKEDDQFKPEVATQIVQKLIEKENVPIITGVAGSNVMMAVYKPITEKQVFLIGTNAGPSPMAGAQCSPFFFSTSWQNDGYAEVVGKYATDKGYKKMLLIGPNYQAGKDALAGFKRYFKGQVIDEIYTPLTQPDFSAEISQIAAAKPDAVYAFFPGSLGVNFVRQYQQAGLLRSLPLLTTGVVDGTTLPALKETALGVIGGQFWGPDTDNPVSKAFVEAFEKKYNRIPSNFAAQGYDSALLLDAAIDKVKGNLSDKKAFETALKAGTTKSIRGTLKFNNHFPVNDWYVFEVVKDAKGRPNLKTVATPLKDHKDAYHAQCTMQ